jgi:hypothetical protein
MMATKNVECASTYIELTHSGKPYRVCEHCHQTIATLSAFKNREPIAKAFTALPGGDELGDDHGTLIG